LIDDIIAEAGEHKTADGGWKQRWRTAAVLSDSRIQPRWQGVEPAKNLANISWSREVAYAQ